MGGVNWESRESDLSGASAGSLPAVVDSSSCPVAVAVLGCDRPQRGVNGHSLFDHDFHFGDNLGSRLEVGSRGADPDRAAVNSECLGQIALPSVAKLVDCVEPAVAHPIRGFGIVAQSKLQSLDQRGVVAMVPPVEQLTEAFVRAVLQYAVATAGFQQRIARLFQQSFLPH